MGLSVEGEEWIDKELQSFILNEMDVECVVN